MTRAKEFFDWVKNDWDEEGDNIYLWDFRELEVQGGLYLKDEFARSTTDSHPNGDFNSFAAEFLVKRIIDIIENEGKTTSLTGSPLNSKN